MPPPTMRVGRVVLGDIAFGDVVDGRTKVRVKEVW